MIMLNQVKQELNVLNKEIELIFPKTTKYSINLVGSVRNIYEKDSNIIMDKRDVDIFIFVVEETERFYNLLCRKLTRLKIESCQYVKVLNIWSLKTIRNGVTISIHIADCDFIKEVIKQHDNPLIYNISLMTFKLNYPTVYRTWINESINIGGDNNILRELQLELKKKTIPDSSASVLKEEIRHHIKYARELHLDNKIALEVIKYQLLEKIISLCYVENNMYYGTVKSIDRDFKHFINTKEIVSLCKEIYYVEPSKFNRTQNYLEKIERVILHGTV